MEETTTKEKVAQIQKEKDEHFKKLVEAELAVADVAAKNTIIPDELIPPVNKEDESGEIIGHVLLNDEYVPLPIAKVVIQERKIVAEYKKLEALKVLAEDYLVKRKQLKKQRGL